MQALENYTFPFYKAVYLAQVLENKGVGYIFLELKWAKCYCFRTFFMDLLYGLRGLALCQAQLSVTIMQSLVLDLVSCNFCISVS